MSSLRERNKGNIGIDILSMLESGYVYKNLQAKGYVCIIDDYEDRAVRVEKVGNAFSYYIKRKGGNEVRSNHYTAEKYLCELNNRMASREEYDAY